MKKRIKIALIALFFSMCLGITASARPSLKEIWDTIITLGGLIGGGGTSCATEISASSSNEVLKCMGSEGCIWVSGSAVNWGGKC